MAKRQTKRERKELARKQRLEHQRRAARRRQLRRVYSVGTVLAIAAVIGGGIWLSGRAQRERDERLDGLVAAAGCSPIQKKLDPSGADHVARGTQISYATSPPTSGDHFGDGTGPTGVSDAPIENGLQVHNLEHGHVGIQFKDAVPAATVEALKRLTLVEANRNWLLVAPNPEMQPALAFTAWGKLVACNDTAKLGNTQAVLALTNEFLTQYRDKSPRESVPQAPARIFTPGASPTPTPTGS